MKSHLREEEVNLNYIEGWSFKYLDFESTERSLLSKKGRFKLELEGELPKSLISSDSVSEDVLSTFLWAKDKEFRHSQFSAMTMMVDANAEKIRRRRKEAGDDSLTFADDEIQLMTHEEAEQLVQANVNNVFEEMENSLPFAIENKIYSGNFECEISFSHKSFCKSYIQRVE